MIPLNGRIIARSESWKQVRNSGVSRPSRPVRARSWDEYSYIRIYGYGSIPINTIFNGMNIHLPAILGFTRCQGFDPSPYTGGHGSRRREYVGFNQEKNELYIYIYATPQKKTPSPVLMLTMIIVSTIDATRVHP